MNRGQVAEHSFTGAFLFCVVAGGLVAACSAGGKDDNPGNFTGTGSAPGSGEAPNFGNAPGSGGEGPQFNAGGTAPGTGNTTGAGGGGTSVAQMGPQNIVRCADLNQFQGASGAGNLRFLYPYAGTVFPRGLAAPLIMWEGGTADAVLVEITSKKFTYRECFPATNPLRLLIPQDAWDGAAGWSEGSSDPSHLTLTVVSGGQVQTVSQDIVFALATMKGAIYYNTYDSPLANANGAVLKVLPRDTAPTVFLTEQGIPPLGPCISCHALSANGATMTANRHLYPGTYESRGYDVAAGTPVQVSAGIPEAGFAAIYPDGSRLLTNGPPAVSVSAFFPTAPGNVAALMPATSHLLDINGNQLNSNWDVPHAQMPMFSPLGDKLVYNDWDNGAGHSLWVADFDAASNQFANKRQIFNDPARFPSWPFFTPDGKYVVFALGTNNEYVSQLPDPLLATFAMRPVTNGLLRIVDVATGQSVPLDQANGYNGGASYLPGGDNDLEFFTTVSPVSGGGYYWALFTSRRSYGNLVNLGKEASKSKKIWCTAINIGAPAGTDPSHPAFVLPGQEMESGNVRAFAALEPCKEDGQSCASGTECCSGYCTNIDPATGIGRCGVITQDQCSRVDDRCVTNANCCPGPDNGALGRPLICIGGFCGQREQ